MKTDKTTKTASAPETRIERTAEDKAKFRANMLSIWWSSLTQAQRDQLITSKDADALLCVQTNP